MLATLYLASALVPGFSPPDVSQEKIEALDCRPVPSYKITDENRLEIGGVYYISISPKIIIRLTDGRGFVKVAGEYKDTGECFKFFGDIEEEVKRDDKR